MAIPPDHDHINAFRKRFLPELQRLFLAIRVIAKERGTFKWGTISLDSTKIKANASKHKALSWKYALKLAQQLKEEVAPRMRLSEEADNRELPDDRDIPAERSRREAALGNAEALLADTGYFSEVNVNAGEAPAITPAIATGREKHNPPCWCVFRPPIAAHRPVRHRSMP